MLNQKIHNEKESSKRGTEWDMRHGKQSKMVDFSNIRWGWIKLAKSQDTGLKKKTWSNFMLTTGNTL